MIQFIVALLLYFVIFFSLAFILNMLLRQSWLMAGLYPFITAIMVGPDKFFAYFTNSKQAFSNLLEEISLLQFADIVLILFGFLGTITSGVVIKLLRRSGYQMF